jgi:UDP-glucose 4-epimerase
MEKSVLITGGCGFIGSTLASTLHDQGYEVRLLDNLLRGNEENVQHLLEEENVELFRGDVRNREVVDHAIDGVNYVVHLAATCLNRSTVYPTESIEVNTMGSNKVFQAAVEEDVDKLLFASSASIYGNQDVPMQEDDRPTPQTPYGISKQASEQLLEYYAENHGLDYISYRFFNVYGAGQDTDAYYTSVINVFVQRLVRGDPPVIHGSGEQTMDFIHVKDIARALKLGIEADVTREVFNVGSGESTSIAELAELLIDIVGAEVDPQYEDRDVLVSHRKASTDKAKEEFGFEAQVPLRNGLEEVVDYVISLMDEDVSEDKPRAVN